MNTDFLAFILIVLLLLLLVEIIILIITIMKDKGNQPYSKIPQIQIPSGYGNETAYGRAWHLELWNASNNTTLSRNFTGQLILGRKVSGNELFWQMNLGSEPSISREQCVIYDRGGFIVLENLSQSNMTYCNGSPASIPTPLYQGTQLTMGRSTFFVVALNRLM